jgi:hypothetical protein
MGVFLKRQNMEELAGSDEIRMQISDAALHDFVKVAWSPLVAALIGLLGVLAGGWITYFATVRRDRAASEERELRRLFDFQAAVRAVVIEMLRAAELALNGSSTILSWSDPSNKSPSEREETARAFEGKALFPLARYFSDRFWKKYEDVLFANLDSATINAIDSAYDSGRQMFDYLREPLREGATNLNVDVRALLCGVASQFSEAMKELVKRIGDANERKQLEFRMETMRSRLASQRELIR